VGCWWRVRGVLGVLGIGGPAVVVQVIDVRGVLVDVLSSCPFCNFDERTHNALALALLLVAWLIPMPSSLSFPILPQRSPQNHYPSQYRIQTSREHDRRAQVQQLWDPRGMQEGRAWDLSGGRHSMGSICCPCVSAATRSPSVLHGVSHCCC
jgi:hypothetical protein